ncbi:purine-cytosine permease family protein [Haladaptatus halobius]|uniref:purine-cytosine permease family protein n=1 Tax=Haladaptatus halobius TaxID=2884875 RepID=UPI001D09FA99|nr:cytosine permease [Haladaptatus halobius]
MALIETEGVNVIPESERTRGFWQIFTIWAGFSIVITNFLLGSLTVGAGLWTGIVAVIVSILLIAIIVYFGTYIAAEEGTAGTTAMRAAFGINGRAIPALATVLATVGWFGVQTGIVAASAKSILTNFGISFPYMFAILALILGSVMASVAIFGYQWIEILNKIAVPVMTILLALVVYQIVTQYGLNLSGGGGSEMSFWAALNVFPAATAAFFIVAMDYGRYGSPTNPDKPSWGATLAWIVFGIALAIIGILAAIAAGDWNPVNIMVELGLGWVGLLLLIAGSWTTNVTNVYVGGIALSQLTGMKRIQMTMLTGAIGTALAITGIFSFGGINAFLGALTITLVPTTGVLLAHYYLFEHGIDERALFQRGGKYWYLRGWHPASVIAWGISAVYAIWANGWIPGLTGAPYLVPALTSAVVAGAIYYGLKNPVENWINNRSPTGTRTAD